MPHAANDPDSRYDQIKTNVGMIDADTPMRLEDAVKIAFPLGGMTVAGLRKEIDKGNLVVEKIANKHFTTLGNIKRMRDKCRKTEKDHDSIVDLDQTVVTTYGSSETDQSSSAQESLQHLVSMRRRKQRKSS
jgi:hypothetical protein